MSNQITPNPSVPTQIVNDGLKFPKFVTNLGIIPTSYKDSMSYYECLAWLCKYLEETVIPTVNQNGEAVEELQALYIELNSYVTHYFETLDVQEEINNKLDDMVEQGTLQEIIADYLNSKAVFGFDTVSEMKNATNLINGSYARTLGFYAKNDGGSALYKIRNITNDDDVDEMFIIEMNDEENQLVAELITSGNEINVIQLGLQINTDITLKLQEIINNVENTKLIFNEGTYTLSDKLDISNVILKGNNTTIEASDNFNDTELLEISDNIEIYNIEFDGNDQVTSIINRHSTNNEIIKDCKFKNCITTLTDRFPLNACVYLTGKNVEFINCSVFNNEGHGVQAFAQQNDSKLIVDNCEFYNNGINDNYTSCGFCEYDREIGERYTIASITNSKAYNNGASGFAVHSIYNVNVINCNSYNNVEHGFVLMDGKNGIIENCIASSNNAYGIRVQGDYNREDHGYENFVIKNNIIKLSGGFWISNNIKNGIIKDNRITASNNTNKYGFLIGDLLWPLEKIEGLNITNNYINNFPYTLALNTSVKYNETNNINNNIIDGKVINGATFNTSYLGRFIDCNNLKYGVSNNVLTAPTDFSNSAWSTGTIIDDSILQSGGLIARQTYNLSTNVKPKYITLIMELNESFTDQLSLGLRFRNTSNTLINFTLPTGQSLQNTAWLTQTQSKYYALLIDMSYLTFSDTVHGIEVYINTSSSSTERIKLKSCYMALSNELPIMPIQ